MLNELASYKGQGKAIKICLDKDIFVSGKILELNPEYVVVDWEGKRTAVQTAQILYFQEV